MTDTIGSQEFEQLLYGAGLDFANDSDYRIWQEELKAYQGDNAARDIKQILAKAVARKVQAAAMKSASNLDEYFTWFREQEQANNQQVKPLPKSNAEMTATEGLNQYFTEWRKKNLP